MVVANTFSKKEPPIKIPRSAPDSQSGCDERKGKWGWGGSSKVSIVYSIMMVGGGGGGENCAWERYIHCAPSPLLY